jgi:hypothetical protein
MAFSKSTSSVSVGPYREDAITHDGHRCKGLLDNLDGEGAFSVSATRTVDRGHGRPMLDTAQGDRRVC